MKLSDDLQISLSVAVSEAGRLGHEYAGLEHLLYALTFDDETAGVLKHSGADIDRVREDLTEYLSEELEKIDDDDLQPRLTLGVQRVLSLAAARVGGSGKEEITGPDVLVALFDEPDSYAVQVLESEGVSRLDVVSYLAHGVSRLQPPYFGGLRSTDLTAGHEEEEDDDEEETRRPGGAPAGDPLQAFAQDLTLLADRGGIDPLVGREREIQRTIQILARRRKNNPLLVGDAGVGKTAIVEGLALKIAQGEVPEPLRKTKVYRSTWARSSPARATAATSRSASRACSRPSQKLENAVLFIDEIHTIVGAGAPAAAPWTPRTS